MDVFYQLDCRYRGCEHLILSCPSCFGTFDCPTLFNSVYNTITEKSTQVQVEESTSNFWQRLRCPKCPEEGEVGRMSPAMIANQVTVEYFVLYMLDLHFT